MRRLKGLAKLLRGWKFRRLFAVRLCSQLSDGVLQVALASYVLFSPERQATPQAIASAFAAVLVPFSVLGPFAGVLLDRWSRRQVLVICNLLRAGLVLGLAASVAAGQAGALFFILVLASLSLNRFLLAALSAALPRVVRRDELVLANALTPTCGTLAFFAGLTASWALRSGVERGGGPGNVVVLAVAAAGYAGAAALAMRLARPLLGPDIGASKPAVREAVTGVVSGLADGARHLWERRLAAYGLVAIGAHRFCYGLSTVATILLYRNYFNPPDRPEAGLAGLSVAVLVSAAGFVAAALLTPYAVGRVGKRHWIVALLALAAFVEVLPGGFYAVAPLLVAAFALGLSAQGLKICVDTIVQEEVDDAFRGRVFSVYDVVFNAAFVAAAALGALVLPVTGKSYPVLALIAGGYALTALTYARLTAGQPPTPAAPRGPAPRPADRAPSAAPTSSGRPRRPPAPAAPPKSP